jgi:hypothetical protein
VDTWTVVCWTLAIPSGLVALYALHRLALRMEEGGYIYYLHKKPKSSGAGCFVAFQKAIEPRVEHVLKVDHVTQQFVDDTAAGEDAPKSSQA